jgi:hypothetical protein
LVRLSSYLIDFNLPACLWSNLKSLEALHLTGNRFRGNLNSFALTKLQKIAIGNNRFYGTLPTEAMKNMSFEFFDISDNLFTGYLDVSVDSKGDNSLIHANVNRFSGHINMESINKFSDINVLRGNIISCETMPEGDARFKNYSCETWVVDYSIISWSVVFAVVFVMLISIVYLLKNKSTFRPIVEKWKLIFNTNLVLFDSKASNMFVLLSALDRIAILMKFLIPSLFILLVVVYMSFRSSNTWSTHYHQYTFIVSGIFLRGSGPAACLLIIFVVVVALLVRSLNKLFPYSEVLVIRDSFHERPVEEAAVNDSIVMQILKIFVLIAFSVVVIVIDIYYVLNLPNMNNKESVLSLVGIFVFDYAYKTFALPWILLLLYNQKNRRESLVAYTLISTLFDIVAPCLATLIGSMRCFGPLNFPEENINVEYSIQDRCLFSLGGECIEFLEFTSSYSFPPPFIYSAQCRNALFSNFMPIIIIGSIFDTFLLPIGYLFSNWYSSDIAVGQKLDATWFQRAVKYYRDNFILGELSFWMVAVFEDFALLSIYGIISPICAVVIATGIVSKTYIMRVGILRTFKLQGPVAPMDEKHIENLCANAMKYKHILLWPSFIAAFMLFLFYIFEMTSDVDEPDKFSVWIIFAFAIAAYLGILVSQNFDWNYYTSRQSTIEEVKIMDGLELRPSSIVQAMVDTGSINNPMVVAVVSDCTAITRDESIAQLKSTPNLSPPALC